jgi:hypothetical protein
MASDLCRQLAEREALVDAEHGRELPVGGVARLVAGLGQALLYFSVTLAAPWLVNTDGRPGRSWSAARKGF